MKHAAYARAIISDLKHHGLIYSCLLSSICVLCAWYLATFSQNRRAELKYVADTLAMELLEMKRHLAQISFDVAHDAVLSRSVMHQKPNTYSAKLKDKLATSTSTHTHIIIFTQTCEPYYQTHPQAVHQDLCHKHNLNQLKWSFAGSVPTLAITRKLSPQYFITTAQAITPEWIAALPIDFAQNRLSITTAEAAPITQALPPQLTYIYSAGVHVTDLHPLSGRLKSYVSPYGTHTFPLPTFIILFLLHIAYLIYHYRCRWRESLAAITSTSTAIASGARQLGMDPAASIETLFQNLATKLHEAECQHRKLTMDIQTAKEDIRHHQQSIAELAAGEYLVAEVQRNAQVLANQLKHQHELEDDTKDLLELIHSLTLHPIAHILKGWQLDLAQRGPRKFLRSYLELMAPEAAADASAPRESLLESHITKLLDATQRLTLLAHSLLKHSHTKTRKVQRLEAMVAYWLQYNQPTATSPAVAELIDYAAWQLRHGRGIKLEIMRPHWLEPPTLSPDFSSVLRSLIYEIFAHLATPDLATPLTLTIHYVPEPTQGLLITHRPHPKAVSPASEPYDTMIQRYQLPYGLCLDYGPPAGGGEAELACTFLSWDAAAVTKQAHPTDSPNQMVAPPTLPEPLPSSTHKLWPAQSHIPDELSSPF